jgi:hypothetical protein
VLLASDQQGRGGMVCVLARKGVRGRPTTTPMTAMVTVAQRTFIVASIATHPAPAGQIWNREKPGDWTPSQQATQKKMTARLRRHHLIRVARG